jgi:hypothetical protein
LQGRFHRRRPAAAPTDEPQPAVLAG